MKNIEIWWRTIFQWENKQWQGRVKSWGRRKWGITLPYPHGGERRVKRHTQFSWCFLFRSSFPRLDHLPYLIGVQGLRWFHPFSSHKLVSSDSFTFAQCCPSVPEESFCISENAKWMKFLWAVKGVVLLKLSCGNLCLLFPFCTQNTTTGIQYTVKMLYSLIHPLITTNTNFKPRSLLQVNSQSFLRQCLKCTTATGVL